NEKTAKVRDLFGKVAKKYDLMNDVMSLGLHRLWKDELVAQIPKTGHLLDVAGGTGDVALRYLRAGGNRATVLDITPAMLQRGRQNADSLAVFAAIDFVKGSAEKLPFPDGSFDAITIAFGLRNITNKETALREARRVLKTGGKFLCLEFAKINLQALDKIYQTYNFKILPLLGKYIADQESSYRYLAESIQLFDDQATLAKKIELGGFEKVGYQNLMAGVVAIHRGYAL
ncbi:MAG: class I SAM-dependent methyltransferase, partial [Alphaproteobacteria bacterium]